jgi:Flp pilus assembly secretin CpaC
MRRFLLTVLTVCSLSLPALAGQQVALPVGHSTTLSLPAPVSKVQVDNPKLVEVQTKGRRVTFVGLEVGRTEVTVKTKDGDVKVSIYVAQDKYALPY